MHAHAMMQTVNTARAPGMERSLGGHIMQEETERVDSV